MSLPTQVIASISEKKGHDEYISSQRKSASRYVLLSALAVLVLINLCCLYGVQLYGEHKYKNCENLISTFEKAKHKPNIVLLGSSLMRIPFYLTDVEHSYYVPNQEDYCWNRTLQNLLNTHKVSPYSVFDFAIDGSMVSDVFLVHRKFLSGVNAPKWIVYGIAPRDLLDNLLSKETRTPLFDRLFDLKDIWLSNSLFNISLYEKLDLTLEKLCYLYHDRSNIQQSVVNTYHDISQDGLLHRQKKDLVNLQQEASDRNLRGYKKRYKAFQLAKFEKQKLFLKTLCENSAKNGTRVLLINMPLTQDIIRLIPAEAYCAYNQTLAEAAKLPGVFVLNLQDAKEFPQSFFGDLVHLNGQGGHLLNMLISKVLLTQDQKQNNTSVGTIGSKGTINTSTDKIAKTILDGLASWWLAKAYFSETRPPDIVVLGGSQLGALLGADAYVYNRSVDFTGDHRSCLLEHDLPMLLNKHFRVFIGALPGCLISDQLITSRALFSNSYKPKLVAITFSPKDFLAKNTSSATTTEPYTFFAKICRAKIDQRRVSMGSKNIQQSCMIAKSMQELLEQKTFKNDDFKPSQDREMLCMSPLNLGNPFQRFCPAEVTISTNDGYSFYDNTQEYKRIYQDPDNQRLKFQLSCLQDLLSYLAQQHIKVVAFNLPLTPANRALLPKNVWSFYNDRIFEICRDNGADFVNLDLDWRAFGDKDFADTAHLNLPGGLKLTRPLALFIANKFHEVDFAELRRREHKMF